MTMNLPKPVTPSEAKGVWARIPNPSARRVAKTFSQAGRRIHHSTIARWRSEGTVPPGHRNPLEPAPSQRDACSPAVISSRLAKQSCVG
jgi:hypothetical protein